MLKTIIIKNKYKFEGDVMEIVFESICKKYDIGFISCKMIDQHTMEAELETEYDFFLLKMHL